jgi:hypothetical protein
MNEVNAADQARDLSVLFQSFAFAVFDYRRLHFADLSEAQRDELEDRAEALLDAADRFTEAAIAATVASLQDSLQSIANVTTAAKQTLKTMNNVQQALAIVGAGLAIAGAVTSGNVGGVASGLQSLIAALRPPDPAAGGPASS